MLDEYAASASVYDAIYESMKDYRAEADRVHSLVESHKRTDGRSLLDVACGTGLHDQYLQARYDVEGLDASEAMLSIARQRLPHMRFHQADMTDFRIEKQFDVVTCLFSAVAHLRTAQRLQTAISCMAGHLKEGGVLLVEPFVAPEQWLEGMVGTNFVPGKRVLRISTSTRKGNLVTLDMHHFVGWDEHTGAAKYFRAQHEMALFTDDEYRQGYESSGLDVFLDETGLMGRGLYIGVRTR